MNHERDAFGTFRRIGSTGLVLFERDGILLRRASPAGDFMLGDINDEIVELLKHLRDRDVRFGFISDERGMDAGAEGRSEFAALTRLLDDLLRIRGARPDFWMAWNEVLGGSGPEFRFRKDWSPKPDAGMILRAMEWYSDDKTKTLFVSSSAAGFIAAINADVMGIQYFGLGSDRIFSSWPGTDVQPPFPFNIRKVRWLRAMIEQRLGLRHRRTA